MIDTKLILKNTFALYIRAVISLIVSLYTTRIILTNLGIENFGIYQVVGGIVLFFAFLNLSLSNATQRYISYYIGLGEKNNLERLFGMTINIHIILAIIIVFFIEVFGFWYIKFEANIGEVRIEDVFFVLHMSAIGLFFNIISVPYRGFLIAKEEIKSFAYIDLLSVFLKLIIAASLIFFSEKRLVVYSLLLMISSLIISIVYKQYCNKIISESRYIYNWDKKLFNELLSFTGWTTIPAISSVLKGQGTILLLNSFFGPVLNASQGIANQVKAGIKTFSLNLLAALSPQITIAYAEKNFKSLKKLVLSGSKITFYIFLFIFIPVIVEIDYILSLWLIKVPEFASTVVLFVLLDTMVSLMTSTYNIAIRATGEIKNYELTVNAIHLMGFPASLFLLYMGFGYQAVFILWIILSIVALFLECYWLNRLLPFISLKEIYFLNLQMMILIGILSMIIPVIVYYLMDQSFLRLLLVTILSFLSVIISSYFFGLTKSEKKQVLRYLDKFSLRF